MFIPNNSDKNIEQFKNQFSLHVPDNAVHVILKYLSDCHYNVVVWLRYMCLLLLICSDKAANGGTDRTPSSGGTSQRLSGQTDSCV